MGQSLKKLALGSEENKAKEIVPIIEECYDKYFTGNNKDWNPADFYHAVSETVEEINKKLSSMQFCIPQTAILDKAFEKHHKDKENTLTKDEFRNILQDVILHMGFPSLGAKDIFFYIFGVPATALLIKQRVIPKLIPNEIFIPGVTSATVFVLAKLNKI
uniref:EF-hand domain-containing protein n=1 Tax=Davidia involucrata TaxID=16924 RepID=A0A5B6YK92_DAVIN